MVYYDSPVGTQKLNITQPQIRNNFSQANTSFGEEHYAFSDETSNNGLHNTVTTPLIIGSAHPTTESNPIFYSMQDTMPVGVIQYSRGPNNAAPTPLTKLHSPLTPITLTSNATTNLLDVSGLNFIYGKIYAINAALIGFSLPHIETTFYWATGVGFIFSTPNSVGFTMTFSGNVIQLRNSNGTSSYNNVYWTLEIVRMQT
jgi:hypothetical protein